MKVSRIVLGDLINAVVGLKTRPCVVIGINYESRTVTLVPLTTETPEQSDLEVDEAPGLKNNRYLKSESYFVYSVVKMPIDKAKTKFAGTTKKETYKYIRKKVIENLNVSLNGIS